ncbi:unnamed protein product, partial [Effrenium voratum]
MPLADSWSVLKEIWFKDEHVDPVFEGVVRDFCAFDAALSTVYSQVQAYMKGVEQLSEGMSVLADGIHSVLSHGAESQTTSDSCKFKEASNQIARADAPHSAVAKLRRDMAFNILTPMQSPSRRGGERSTQTNLEIRQRRLVELHAAKRSFEEAKKNHSERDPRHIEA